MLPTHPSPSVHALALRDSKQESALIIQGQSWEAMKQQASLLVKSGFLPESIKTTEQAIAIAIKGHEIGMPMMQAFSQIHVIKGKPTISAEGMNALIRRNCPGSKIEIIRNDSSVCTIKATRPGERAFEYSYTIEDAKRAGIAGNPSWSKYPDAMLFARCISAIARRVFPDCLCGISYTPEELGAEVNEEGEVIKIEATQAQETQKKVGDTVEHPIVIKKDEKYNSNDQKHRDYLKKEALVFGISDNRSLLQISEYCKDVELTHLGEAIGHYLDASIPPEGG